VVGYWSYDFSRRLERLPAQAVDDLGLPEVVLGFYDVIGAFDHHTRQAWLFSSGLPFEDSMRSARAEQRLDQFLRLFDRGRRGTIRLPARFAHPVQPVSTFSREGYLAAIERVQELIRAGEIYQANLSQRWTLPIPGADLGTLAMALHDALSLLSAAPVRRHVQRGQPRGVVREPERFLELRSGRVETRPIKGTRPRGLTKPETGECARSCLRARRTAPRT
jgi:para-aminobenzoate synthetase component 1